MANSGWYYGMDTNSATPFPCAGDGHNFYIGRLGGGVTAGGTGFDSATADAVGAEATFAYWDLVGPGNAPSGTSPEEWGIQQAQAFQKTWDGNFSVSGTTLFADIEPGNGGWSGEPPSACQQVLNGFLETISDPSSGFYPGVYISVDNWNAFFESSYVSPIPFVLWLAGTDCPSTCTDAADQFNANHLNQALGGYKVLVWQYYVPSCSGSRDLDITPYDGYFTNSPPSWRPIAS